MERWAVEVRGIVQGVGFRPFVYHLATGLGLVGHVQNQTSRVLIEIEGPEATLDRFVKELTEHRPPLARIDHVSYSRQPLHGDGAFRILPSAGDEAGPAFISPDAAVCAECLAELFNPCDRRFGYPFLNCTHCGPRLTIMTGTPYDRARTTMNRFAMCADCQAEYDDLANRRFHAQAITCPTCGPQLALRDGSGRPLATAQPLGDFACSLREGRIGALKGLGGWHLTCDARNPAAVAELRRRKHRDEKPFAIMVSNVDQVEALCEVSTIERERLESSAAPIVLLRKRQSCEIVDAVAPRQPRLGVMLPYTPLHHLLVRAVEVPLVMTSGNRSDEPIAYRDDATETLAGIADLFLTHNRPIHIRCDDSVTRVIDGVETPVRRSRGYAPQPIALPFDCPAPLLAVGGQQKATFALGRDRLAFLSHHLGDLDHYDAYRAFEHDLTLYEPLLGIHPDRLVCDQHPDYSTTAYARQRCEREGKSLLAVQHHHAHMASCMAENGLTALVIGVTFDGTGFGTDGAIWGGEFLTGDYRRFHRAAHLRYVPMPGGEAAIREPWRMAVAHLADANVVLAPFDARHLHPNRRAMHTMMERRLNAPSTSSVGRLFDAIASITGVRDRVSYEGQAAVELEAMAEEVDQDVSYPFTLDDGTPRIVETRPLIRAVATDVENGVSPARIARRFHSTLVEIVVAVCGQIRGECGLQAVVLSGGVFLNALLTSEVCARLTREGFRVYRHRLVPPNDGGLSLGQLAVAAHLAIE